MAPLREVHLRLFLASWDTINRRASRGELQANRVNPIENNAEIFIADVQWRPRHDIVSVMPSAMVFPDRESIPAQMKGPSTFSRYYPVQERVPESPTS